MASRKRDRGTAAAAPHAPPSTKMKRIPDAIPLVRIVDRRTLVVPEEALMFLRSINDTIGVLVVVGRSRSGDATA